MSRRKFIVALIGGAAAWPLGARGQQPAIPVVGLINSASPSTFADRLRAFHEGLKETGHVEGDNIAVEYRWAEGQNDRLPAMAGELVGQRVAVIAALGEAATFATKAATSTIPVVFNVDDDPVKLGLVTNLARPGGNLTGTNFLSGELIAKRLELLRELVPTASRVAVLVNSTYPATDNSVVRDVAAAALSMGLQIEILDASTTGQIDAAFTSLVDNKHDALFVGGDPFFTSRRQQLVNLALQHAIPATFGAREFTVAGGLMSYGANIADAWRQVGAYVGQILKGKKPSDLPVVQPTRFDFVINLKTARALGLTIPPTLLARADEVIE